MLDGCAFTVLPNSIVIGSKPGLALVSSAPLAAEPLTRHGSEVGAPEHRAARAAPGGAGNRIHGAFLDSRAGVGPDSPTNALRAR